MSKNKDVNTVEEMVVTVGGLSKPKSETRSIGGKRYFIGNPNIQNSGECYLLDGKYYTVVGGRIIWHQRCSTYVDVRTINPMGNEVVGKLNGQNAIYIPDINIATFLNEENQVEHVTREYASSKFLYNKYYDCYYVNKNQGQSISNYVRINNYTHFDMRLYSLADYETNPHDVVKFDKKPIQISPLAMVIEAILNGNSFGVEMETQSGKVPEIALLQHRVTPVKDGSIAGAEYVTLPNYTASDIQKTIDFFDYIRESCTVNDQCSLHVHVLAPQPSYTDNNIKLFAISLWMLYYQIQRELTESIPHYKKTYGYLNSKNGKDHCQDLPSLSLFQNKIYNADGSLNVEQLNAAFDTLFAFINGRPSNKQYNLNTRRSSYSGGRKWDIMSRYFALNIYPIFFGDVPTAEYRVHSGTVNPTKIVNWILICNAITRFAQNNIKLIVNREQKIDLELILSGMRNNFGNSSAPDIKDFVTLSNYLIEYMRHRREYFTSCRLTNDNYGMEFQQDKGYDFKMNGRNVFQLFE